MTLWEQHEKLKAKARRLRDEGLSYPAIGKRLGRSRTAIYKWLNPEYTRCRRLADRQRKREQRRTSRY